MAKGILNIQANDGAVIGLHVPDGLTSGERPISLGVNLSGIASYHLLQGNLAISSSTTTQGFNTTLYTGNGSTLNVTTGIDMNTQWGNSGEERFGGLVWGKSRSGTTSNAFTDTIRGVNNTIFSNLTDANSTTANRLTSFNSNGFSLGTDTQYNASAATYASWNFQTTHRVTGTTNHGKAYTCHYNPFTGFTIVKYEGSGISGHEIPHMLGRKLGLYVHKNLSATASWTTQYKDGSYLSLNLTNAEASAVVSTCSDAFVIVTTENISTNQYILYGWANSYLDKSNKLIGNYEVGVYQGTGASGNKITTRGKPAWIMIKRIDSTSDWHIFDNQRDDIVSSVNDGVLWANTSGAEATTTNFISLTPTDGFIINDTTANTNASGGQYLYLVAYDTNANGGGSYYPLASDTANVQVNNALIPIAQGIDSNGAKNIILSKNETFSGVTYTSGKNYPYYDALGNRGVSVHKPRYLESELVRTYAGESPDYFNVKENKWYSTNSGSELVTNGNGLSLTGWVAKDVNSGYPDSILSLSNQTIVITNSSTAGSDGGAYQLLTGLIVGKKYKVKLSQDGTVVVQVGVTSYLATARYAYSAVGATEFEFIAQATSVYLTFYNSVTTANDSCWIDNVTCFQTDITPITEITNGRNYLNHIVYADNDGGVLYVEELPKIEYKDIVKANEFKGKNACTAWVNFDGTTTPPTIRDSYNVSAVIRTGTSVYDVYFKEPMDNTNYGAGFSSNAHLSLSSYSGDTLYKTTVATKNYTNALEACVYNKLVVTGGKN